MYQICYTIYDISFYLWQFGLVLIYQKVPKYYGQNFLETFLLLATLSMMIQLSGKSAHSSLGMLLRSKNQLSGKVKTFQKPNFHLDQK